MRTSRQLVVHVCLASVFASAALATDPSQFSIKSSVAFPAGWKLNRPGVEERRQHERFRHGYRKLTDHPPAHPLVTDNVLYQAVVNRR